jgi:hypothetical protein
MIRETEQNKEEKEEEGRKGHICTELSHPSGIQ